MQPNLKVDIIYYKTPTDFEMEFYLGGCCHMRQLSDKSTDKKSYVKSLATAVSRSRVIIACGPLFSDTGLINITAKAIGHPLKIISAEETSIKSGQDIEIIEGSVPLVLGGDFGGCIIESGPQTIILLTENRELRKNVMESLIHPYVTEVALSSFRPAEETAEPEMSVTEPVSEEPATEEISETEETKTEDIALEEQETEIVFEAEDEPLADEEAQEEETSEIPDMQSVFNDEEEEKESSGVDRDYEPRKSTGLNIAIIVLSVMLLLVIAVILYLVVYVPISQGQEIPEYIRSLFDVIKE